MIDVKEMPTVQEVEIEAEDGNCNAWLYNKSLETNHLVISTETVLQLPPIFETTPASQVRSQWLVLLQVYCLPLITRPWLIFSSHLQLLVGLWVMKELQSLYWTDVARPQTLGEHTTVIEPDNYIYTGAQIPQVSLPLWTLL